MDQNFLSSASHECQMKLKSMGLANSLKLFAWLGVEVPFYHGQQ